MGSSLYPTKRSLTQRVRMRFYFFRHAGPFPIVLLLCGIVFLVSFCVFLYAPRVFTDDVDNGVWNSLGFGVTTTSFFVALVIFRIQTFPELECDLYIRFQQSSSKKKAITMVVYCGNRGISDFKGQINVEAPRMIQWKRRLYINTKDDMSTTSVPHNSGVNLHIGEFELFDKKQAISNCERQSMIRPTVRVLITPSSRFMKFIFGTRSVSVTSSSLQGTIDDLLRASDSKGKRGVIIAMR